MIDFASLEKFQKISQNDIFQKVVQAGFSILLHLQMTSIDTFQDTSGCRVSWWTLSLSKRK